MSRGSDAQRTRNFHHHHASGTRGIDTRRRIFHRKAFHRRNAQSTRGFEINVRCGLADRDIIRRDDFIKPIGNTEHVQGFFNDKTRTTRRDAQRHFAAPLTREVRHFFDQLTAMQFTQKRLALGERHACGIELQTVFRIEIDHNVLGRTTTHGVENIFRQHIRSTILRESFTPRIEVSGHGVNQRAVTIKDDRRER